ncbi:MAG: metallophosphoesterase [candidate division Zixibacteria bacterium]|nr:metallophosphoesterase [candidate division Zixibacteria bacterium]
MQRRIIYKHLICFAILIFIEVCLLPSGIVAGEVGSPADSARSVEYYNDGPHVHRANDSTVIVFYLLKGAVVQNSFTLADTLRFRGFGADTALEYLIINEPLDSEIFIFEDVSKIFALSDVHGEYEYMAAILTGAGIIDSGGHWNWGTGHLVIDGDVFDRGDMVTECLWLIYRLEQEARRAGGAVHFILGNHELMVLRGDNRYINEKYLDGIVKKTGIKHEDLYGPDMELGRWLRSLPAIIKINDILFVHGGIHPYVLDYGFGIGDLNDAVRRGLDLRTSQLAFNDTVTYLFGNEGPFWYRGYHYEMENKYPKATEDELDRILSYFDARKIVVGHSEVDSVVGLYDNKVFAIDIPTDEFGGFQGLLWEGGRFYRVAADGARKFLDY